MTYVGCYSSVVGDRSLPYEGPILAGTATHHSCAVECLKADPTFAYVAVEVRRKLYCSI